MDDAAVVARLMRREPRLLVDDGQARSRVGFSECHGRSEADDAATDQDDVRGVWHGQQDTTTLREDRARQDAAPGFSKDLEGRLRLAGSPIAARDSGRQDERTSSTPRT